MESSRAATSIPLKDQGGKAKIDLGQSSKSIANTFTEDLYDVVIIGGGPIGLSAAHNSAKLGKKVLLLERYNFFNQNGSSNDFVRLFRTMYKEDYLADLAKEALDSWKELQKESGEELIWMTGLLNFGDPAYVNGPEGNLMDPVDNLKRLNMPYRVLTPAQIMEEFPFKDLPDHFVGIWAQDNGCINVPSVLRTLYRLALAYGAKLVQHAQVIDMNVGEDLVEVKVANGTSYKAKKCIVAAGAYTNNILSSVGLELNLEIWEMVYSYFSTNPGPKGTFFPSAWFQFQDPTGGDPAKSNLLYGFPSLPWMPPNLVRIAVDNAVNIIDDPKKRLIVPSDNDVQVAADFIEKHCVGVDNVPNFSGSCLMTNAIDNNFILDQLPSSAGPGHKNVVIFTAGWAFKFTPLLGKILTDLTFDGKTPHNISNFKITRPGVLKTDFGKL